MAVDIFDPRFIENVGIRRQVSLFSKERAGLKIMWPDPVDISVSVVSFERVNDEQVPQPDTLVIIPTEDIISEGDGAYSFEIPPEFTSKQNMFTVIWTYSVKGQEIEFSESYDVLHHMPLWDSFSDAEKGMVDKVLWRIADLYDNTMGGVPYFAEEFQSQFNNETIARLMSVSLDKINSSRSPITSFGLGPGAKPYPLEWSGLLVTATYIEMIKHFMRSYVEQPNLQGTGVAQADRRDYLQRWQTILNMETAEYSSMLVQFKRKQLSFGSGSLIVAGGIFGSGGMFRPGMYASAARAGRFYPVSYVNVG